jgi:hypothetical protein
MAKANWFKAHKYQIIIGVLVSIVLVLLARPPQDSNPITYNPPPSSTKNTLQAPKFEAINLSGTGAKVTDPFELKNGGYKVSSNHIGENNFTVYLVNSQGENGPLVANEIGSANVSDVINVKGGKYFFKVGASGNWTIKIEAL